MQLWIIMSIIMSINKIPIDCSFTSREQYFSYIHDETIYKPGER